MRENVTRTFKLLASELLRSYNALGSLIVGYLQGLFLSLGLRAG